ncbi:MAG: osmotically inducible protein OsmC [Nitrospirae bacterium RBG_13_43_8]|nr:MAG: osmotically inducible protein OsmC [Nitrospirae bacterium RBG_13_43_8]
MSEAKVIFTSGLQFVGEASSGHAIVMDGDPEVGGHNTGLRPMELLLVGLGGCAGMDVVSILRKKKQGLTGLEVTVRGQRAENYPKKYTDIEIDFLIKGRNISEEAVRKAIDLSMNKYCSVKAALDGSAKIKFTYKISSE